MDGISESGESIQLVRAMINPNVTVQEIEAKKYRPPMAEKRQNNVRDFVDEDELERHSVAGRSDYSRADDPKARADPDEEDEVLADNLYRNILGEKSAGREPFLPDRRGRTGGDDGREPDRRGRSGGDDGREPDRREANGRREEEPGGWFSRGFDEIPEVEPRGTFRSGGRDTYRSGEIGRDLGGRDEYGGEKKIEFSEGDILRSKHTMLIELNALESQGAKLTKNYTMYDPVDDIHFELLRQQNIVDCLTTVDHWILYIVASMFVIEWINFKLGAPLYFTGVGEYMQGNMENVRAPLQKCYHRYVHRSTSSPVWDVVKALGASLFTYHMENMLMGGNVNKKPKSGKKEAGTGSARGSTAAAPSSIFSFLPMMMKSFGGGGAAKSAPAARSGGNHTPFSPSVPPGDMQMPPDFFGKF